MLTRNSVDVMSLSAHTPLNALKPSFEVPITLAGGTLNTDLRAGSGHELTLGATSRTRPLAGNWALCSAIWPSHPRSWTLPCCNLQGKTRCAGSLAWRCVCRAVQMLPPTTGRRDRACCCLCSSNMAARARYRWAATPSLPGRAGGRQTALHGTGVATSAAQGGVRAKYHDGASGGGSATRPVTASPWLPSRQLRASCILRVGLIAAGTSAMTSTPWYCQRPPGTKR